MRKILFIASMLPLISVAVAQSPLNIMTFNIRYNNPSDSPNHWAARKDKVSSQILFQDADIVGVQEALNDQANDLKQRMPAYGFAGVGRDDGKEKGEYSAIFYKRERLELLESKTFWLSTTPNVPGSKGWDAAITRIVTWAKFKDKATGKIFFHFNTHFDHMGQEARRQSAHLLLQKVQEIAGKTPTIVTGDFNANPADEPIRIVMNNADPLHLVDSKAISSTGHYGPTGTFTAFGPKETDDQPIDYIFVKGNWKVLKHATLSQSWEGRFASDHFSVFARLVME